MEYIYKSIKYGIKTDQPEILSTINSQNCKKLYLSLKSDHINTFQIGGNLINVKQESNVKLQHVVFHGNMANDRILHVPINMFLFLPLCCGFTVSNSIDEFAFFNDDEHNIIKKLNAKTKNSVIQVGKKKYIVLKEGDEYCDIEISYIIDLFLEEGIFTNSTKKENNDVIIKLLESVAHNNTSIFTITPNTLELFKLIRTDIKLKSLEPTDINNLAQLYYIIDQITSYIDRHILFSNVYGHILQQHINKQYNKIFEKFYDGLQKTKEIQKRYSSIPDITSPKFINKFIEHVSYIIIILQQNMNDSILIKIQLFYSNIKKIKPLDLFIDLCIILNDNNDNHVENLTLENTNWKTEKSQIQYISFTESNLMFRDIFISSNYKNAIIEMPICTHILMEMGKCIAQLCKLMLLSEFEYKFLIQKYKSQESGHVKIYLSDVLNAIKLDNPQSIHFIVNKSCQGFQEDSDICVINKCFSKIISKLNPDLSTNNDLGTFDQQNNTVLVKVIKKILELHEYQIINNYSNEKHKGLFFDLQCIIHNLKIFDPDIITKVFIYHANMTYPHVINSLKYSIKHENQNMELWKKVHIKVVIAVINLFITDVYLKLTESSLKSFIKTNMGELH